MTPRLQGLAPIALGEVAIAAIGRVVHKFSRQGYCAPELRGRRGLTAAYGWEPAPLGGGRTGGVGAAAPRPQGGRATARAPYGWGGGGNISTVGYFVHKFDNFAVVFERKK